MAVKSLLRALAIEYPRSHDIGPILLFIGAGDPEDLRKNIKSIFFFSFRASSNQGIDHV